jgi:hypothetical protein
MKKKCEVKKAPFYLGEDNRWFVAGFRNSDGLHGYVHQDGTVHSSTSNDCTNKKDGWYKTREQARKAARLYRAKNS